MALAGEKPRFGYRRLHVLLKQSGERVNHKRVWRVYREAGLMREAEEAQATACGPGRRHGLSGRANQEWALDFVHDAGGLRAAGPRAERAGCLHAGVSGAGGGHELCQSAR